MKLLRAGGEMAEYVGPDGGYFIDGDDLDHVRTVMRWKDADGVCHCREFVAPYSTFRLWHSRAAKVIDEVERRRAEQHVLSLPKGKLRRAKG